MMFLVVSWVLSLGGLIILISIGMRRLSASPVTHEFHWQPLMVVRGTVIPFGKRLLQSIQTQIREWMHGLFHTWFHSLKGLHDRVFGRQVRESGGAPSFFLKTIAEHKEEYSEKYKEERKDGF